jgi:hypothetical protein
MTFLADGAMSRGIAVCFGSDDQHVTGAGDQGAGAKVIGILQNDPTGPEDYAEVALPGGGAKAKLGDAVSAGDFLIHNYSSNDLVHQSTHATVERICAMALEDGSGGDLIAVEVMLFRNF